MIKHPNPNNLAKIFINAEYDYNFNIRHNSAPKFTLLNMYFKLMKKFDLLFYINRDNLPDNFESWKK